MSSPQIVWLRRDLRLADQPALQAAAQCVQQEAGKPHSRAGALFLHYNFCRIHKSLKTSPAMAAGIADTLWSLDDVIVKIDELAPPPAKRVPYKKRS
ncbi:MAG: deoxyribodipyrimidine photo-lyase [Qipengyuania sp.]